MRMWLLLLLLLQVIGIYQLVPAAGPFPLGCVTDEAALLGRVSACPKQQCLWDQLSAFCERTPAECSWSLCGNGVACA